MSALVLIPWAATEWTASGRLAARTPLPLTEAGRAQAEAWGREFATREFFGVYTSEEQTSLETAKAVALGAGAKVRDLDGLEEVHFGLWEGLTEETLKSRFPKAYKRWREDPSSVCPPEGEDLAEAAARIRKALRTVKRKMERASVAVVLGPTACALVRCELAGAPLSELRAYLAQTPIEYSDAEQTLQAVTPTPTD
ncbi:MAG TPA: histidine phosphatase family protein [Phycisphaerae bacterium]|nr:histidine phosphatase family protein [Phycisphaerales bacterium]HRX85549.1 histidine phosphatase family protein [Phycisphaerae bacterium]